MSTHFHANDNHINYKPHLYVLLCLATVLHVSHTICLHNVDYFFLYIKKAIGKKLKDFVFCFYFWELLNTRKLFECCQVPWHCHVSLFSDSSHSCLRWLHNPCHRKLNQWEVNRAQGNLMQTSTVLPCRSELVISSECLSWVNHAYPIHLIFCFLFQSLTSGCRAAH